MEKNKFSYVVLILLFVSIVLGIYLNEDSTGGAKNDYLHHEKFIFLFAENFIETFKNYGTDELMARNSPIFYIFLSLFFKAGVDIKFINFANLIILPLYIFVFINCIKIKYKFIKLSDQILFSSIILLSPTIRSLTIWPYPFVWGLLFFLISILFFLKFKEEIKESTKFKFCLYNIFFLALSAYITPNFAVFSIFYFINFFVFFKNSKINFIILFNLILAFPALYYYYKTDFYIFKYTVETVNIFLKFNFINKIIIISSLIFFYYLPFINFYELKNLNLKNFIVNKSTVILVGISLFFFIFFNFPLNLGFGGGIFLHLSDKILNNPGILFLIFIISILIFINQGMINKNNLILFVLLLIYNTQTSIYHKYFDPLVYFLILFLFEYNQQAKFRINLQLFNKIFIFYGLFLIISILKKYIMY